MPKFDCERMFCFRPSFGTFTNMRINGLLFSSLVLASISMAGCARDLTPTEQGTLVGAGVGGGMGAVVGSAVGSPGAGVAIGGVSGGALGAFIGQETESSDARMAQMQEVVRRQQQELDRQEREIQDLKRQREANAELSRFGNR